MNYQKNNCSTYYGASNCQLGSTRYIGRNNCEANIRNNNNFSENNHLTTDKDDSNHCLFTYI